MQLKDMSANADITKNESPMSERLRKQTCSSTLPPSETFIVINGERKNKENDHAGHGKTQC